jgi:hypothetical protein
MVALLAVLLGAGSASAQQQTAFVLDPTELSLGATTGSVTVQVDNAPPFQGYRFTLAFDDDLVAVTAVEDGGLLTSQGGLAVLELDLSKPGRLGVYATNPSLPDGTSPAGGGALARITLAPLAAGGPSPMQIGDAALVDLDGVDVAVERLASGTLSVVQTPPEAVQTEAVAQATALASSSADTGSSLVPDMPDIGEYGSALIWLALLALAIAVVVVGWLWGRRPADI